MVHSLDYSLALNFSHLVKTVQWTQWESNRQTYSLDRGLYFERKPNSEEHDSANVRIVQTVGTTFLLNTLVHLIESVRNYNLCMRVEETVACNCEIFNAALALVSITRSQCITCV